MAHVGLSSKDVMEGTFDPLGDKKYGDPDFSIGASVSSGLDVSFAASGKCTVSGTTLHIVGAGTCDITASQDGNGNYKAALPVTRCPRFGCPVPVTGTEQPVRRRQATW